MFRCGVWRGSRPACVHFIPSLSEVGVEQEGRVASPPEPTDREGDGWTHTRSSFPWVANVVRCKTDQVLGLEIQ